MQVSKDIKYADNQPIVPWGPRSGFVLFGYKYCESFEVLLFFIYVRCTCDRIFFKIC